jgi:hypothetical protein
MGSVRLTYFILKVLHAVLSIANLMVKSVLFTFS